MEIREKDFILEYEDGHDRFTLSLLYIKNAKKEDKKSEEFKIYGYGMTIQSCLSRIINNRIANNNEVISLKDYLAEFKRESLKLRELTKL